MSKSISGPHQIKMDDEELLTWLHLVTDKINSRPLILGAPLGITLMPNHILLGFRDSHGDEVNPDVPVQHQLSQWKVILNLFNSLWTQEYTRRRLTVTWKQQGSVPQVGDIILMFRIRVYILMYRMRVYILMYRMRVYILMFIRRVYILMYRMRVIIF